MAATEARSWFISGRVQGVGFRDFVQRRAVQLGLIGWTRNLEDGRVEVYAVGNAKQLSDLAAALYAGPALSDVRTVDERIATPAAVNGFRVR